MYVIDGNNVAGKLKMLGEENFDRKLVAMLLRWNAARPVKATVVFDGGDLMGDRRTIDSFLTVVYTPRDSFYRDADDKIVEIVRQSLLAPGEAVVLVTEDRELVRRVESEADLARERVEVVSSGEFALKLKFNDSSPDPGGRDLDADEVRKINEDLLKQWT